MTPAERMLWGAIRAKALGVRWRRQHVLRGFILDFYAPQIGMVLEVDGPVHDAQQTEDSRRETALEELGLFVVRVTNREVFYDIDGLLKRLRALITPLAPKR